MNTKQLKEMKMFKKFYVLFMLLFWIVSFNIQTVPAQQAGEIESTAREFISLLAKEAFSSATKSFDKSMREAMPPGKLEQMWTAIIGQAGDYKEQNTARNQKFQQYDVVFVTCVFKRITLDARVVLDGDGRIAGLSFVPTQKNCTYKPPAYAETNACIEREVVVGKGAFSLPGTLSLPQAKGGFPAVVLVHGSGPQDRDETIECNKPFRDLAWGLATRGIAVLRYEKRTKHYAAKFAAMKNKFTVEEETIVDALAAVSLLQNISEIDNKRIFVLGHSLGGTLVPRIAQRNMELAGFVIMAGTTRPLEDVIYEQFEYLLNLDDQLTDHDLEQLKQLRMQVQMVKSGDLTETTPSNLLPLGLPAGYWMDIKNYDPARAAARMKRPILILQGERDYQVTMVDFNGWQESLLLHKNVKFKLFPSLNHLFMYGNGRSIPSEYKKPGHVHFSVIEEICDWIQDI